MLTREVLTRSRVSIPRWVLIGALVLLGMVKSPMLLSQQAAEPGGHRITLADAAQEVRDGKADPYELEMTLQANATELIPALEAEFAKTDETEPFVKGKLAEVLVKLGDANQQYWDYLAMNADAAVQNDAPSPFAFDAEGKVTGESPALERWAKAHNTPVEIAFTNAEYVWPSRLMLLAWTGDRRAIPILRKGLASPNHVIQSMAAKGLAELQDKESVPLISDALEKAPKEAAEALAEPLLYFDDPKAQEIATKHLSAEKVQRIRAWKTAGHTALK